MPVQQKTSQRQFYELLGEPFTKLGFVPPRKVRCITLTNEPGEAFKSSAISYISHAPRRRTAWSVQSMTIEYEEITAITEEKAKEKVTKHTQPMQVSILRNGAPISPPALLNLKIEEKEVKEKAELSLQLTRKTITIELFSPVDISNVDQLAVETALIGKGSAKPGGFGIEFFQFINPVLIMNVEQRYPS